jgi:hypothetical protein
MKISDFTNLIAAMPTTPHSSRAKSDKKWKPVLERTDAAGIALQSLFGAQKEICISRGDLRALAKETGLERFVMGTLLWGYPDGMQGNHVANMCDNLATLTALLDIARSQGITDWNGHFQKVTAIGGVGLSTYTKFLNFFPANVCGHTALILDDRIITVAKRGVFAEFTGSFSAPTYPVYLERMHQIAKGIGVPSENLEFFLYLFGPDLKPTEDSATV